MSWTPVDTTPPSTDEGTLQPVQDYSRTAEITPFRTVRTSVYVPRERRLWTAALAAALLITAGGLGMLYVDDTNNQNAINALTLQNEELTGKSQSLQTALATTQIKLTASQNQVSDLTAELAHPTLGIWNVPQTISDSTYYLAAGVPDTFTYHLKLTSSGPMSVSILSIKQFGLAVMCVRNGVADTNYCMHHQVSARDWFSLTSINEDFHLSEGCAAYLVVITASRSVTVTPDVSVTYNPASGPTGECA